MPDYFVVDINGKTIGRLILDSDEIPKMMVDGVKFSFSVAFDGTTKKPYYFALVPELSIPKPKLKLHVYETMVSDFLRPGMTFVFKCDGEIIDQKFFGPNEIFDNEQRAWAYKVYEDHKKTCNQ